MEMVYSNDIGNQYCRQIIFNTIKHIFINTYLKKVIKKYKDSVLTFLTGEIDKPTEQTTTLVVLNDDGVNRRFGWALIKLKKNYTKVKHTSGYYIIVEGNMLMLEDISIVLQGVIDKTNYMRVYYLLDGAIINKRYITFIAPDYILRMSALFKSNR